MILLHLLQTAEDFYPYDLLASIYELAGIDYNTKLPHLWGLEANILPPKEEVKSEGLLREIM